MTLRSGLGVLGLVAFGCTSLAQTNPTVLDLSQRSFFLDRDYFVLRSGRAQAVVQADRADVGPAFTYLLFDATQAAQSARKERAFNFVPGVGFAGSALVVELGGFPFTAVGHRTDTRWVLDDGIPAAEAVWWAGGVRVTERLAAIGDLGLFRRRVRLEGAHLSGPEAVKVRSTLPCGECQAEGNVAVATARGANLALTGVSSAEARGRAEGGVWEFGPVMVEPGREVDLTVWLLVEIPAGARAGTAERLRLMVASEVGEAERATRARWATAASVVTQDRTVQGIFEKARFSLPGMIAEDGTMDAGIFEYGAQWVRDTSCTALGALHAGHFEAVRAALVRMLGHMVSADGVTMIGGGFDAPDLEQFDQMGELLHLLRAYRDWTGDDSPVREHRGLLRSMIERPLQPRFRDDTGMVHNRREFWERTFEDAYELAYQTYVILGL